MIQFGSADERDFRVALNSSSGREHFDNALMKIDAEHAHASVETDRNFILAILQRDMASARSMGLFEAAPNGSTGTLTNDDDELVNPRLRASS